MKKRIVALILAGTILLLLCVPAFAVESVSGIGYDSQLDTTAGDYWGYFAEYETPVNVLLNKLDDLGYFVGVNGSSISRRYWNWRYSVAGYGEVSYRQAGHSLNVLQTKLNGTIAENFSYALSGNSELTQLFRSINQASKPIAALAGRKLFNLELRLDSTRNVYRPYDTVSQQFVTDTYGRL